VNAKILRLNKAGIPVSWLTQEETTTLLVKGLVVWSMGSTVFEMRGGINRSGKQSVLRLPSIVACDGKVHENSYSGATRTSVSTVAISLRRMTSLEIMYSLSLVGA
jgi:hypothetical protein